MSHALNGAIVCLYGTSTVFVSLTVDEAPIVA